MIDFTKEGRIGDKVKSMRCGKGTIVAIGNRETETYPIVVAHDSGGQSTYTATGKHLETYSHPSLMFDSGSLSIDQGSPPERESERLYCGLTNQQWQRVVDERFLVEVSDCQEVDWISKSTTVLRYLIDIVPHYWYPYKTRREQWTRARIPKEVGIRKPHFGGKCPCDPEQQVTVKFEKSFVWAAPQPAKVFHWEPAAGEFRIIEYIELP